MGPVFFILCFLGVLLLILILPLKGARSFNYKPPSERIHEADAVLSRRLLTSGTKAYESYYASHPEFQEADDRSRSAPGLLHEKARLFEAGTFAASKANFQIIDYLGSLTHGPAAASPIGSNPEKNTAFITNWLKLKHFDIKIQRHI